jgi:hypothetical protein
VNQPHEAPFRDRLEAIAVFRTELDDPDVFFGTWEGGNDPDTGTLTMPWVRYSDLVTRFTRAAYDFGWIRTDVNWVEWKETPEAIRLRDEPGAIEEASEDQLAKLLTVVIRQDRFVEGELMSAFESGMIARIVRRASGLLAKLPPDAPAPR